MASIQKSSEEKENNMQNSRPISHRQTEAIVELQLFQCPWIPVRWGRQL